MKEAKVWFSRAIVWNMKYFGEEYINYIFDALEHYYHERWDEFFQNNDGNLAKYESDIYNPVYVWEVNKELRVIVDADIPDDLRWTITVMRAGDMANRSTKNGV